MRNVLISRPLWLSALLLIAGCAGTAMTRNESGSLVPVRGWKSTAWHVDPVWVSSGTIGKDEFRKGPWWYGDPVWQPLSVGQGGITSNRWGLVEAKAQPALTAEQEPAASNAAPGESTK